MSILKSVLAISTGLVLLASPAAAANLLPNPGFDSDIDGWDGLRGTPMWSGEDAHGGAGSVQQFSDDAIGVAITTCIDVTPDTAYDVTVDVLMSVIGDAFGKVGIQVFWHSGDDCVGEVGGLQPFALHTSAFEWQHMEILAIVPASATTASVNLVVQRFQGSEGSSVTGWIDNPFFGEQQSTTTSTVSTTTMDIPGEPGCGDPSLPYDDVTVADALQILRGSVGVVECLNCLCDTNRSGGVTVADALGTLRSAVGQEVTLRCGGC